MLASAKVRHQFGAEFLIDSPLIMAFKFCLSKLRPETLDKPSTVPLLWGKTPNKRRRLFFLLPQTMQLSPLRDSIPFQQNIPLLEGLILLREFLKLLVLPSRVTLPYLGLVTSKSQFF
jgi:hypothetical protein